MFFDVIYSICFSFFYIQFDVLMIPICLRWEFLGSRMCDRDLANVICLESDIRPTWEGEAGKSTGKSLDCDGGGISGTQIIP